MVKKLTIVFGIVGVLIGVMLTFQFQTSMPLSLDFAADEALARENLFKEFLDEQLYLQDRIINLRGEISQTEADLNIQSETANLEILESLKMEVGLSKVHGIGLTITLQDGKNAVREGANVSDKDLVQASDIRDLINILFASNADAIAINDQRVIASSAIASVGTTILVNNAYITPPFLISAVGDSDIMLQRILNDSLLKGLHERNKKQNILFKIVVKNIMTIPIYSGDLKTNYLNLVNKDGL
ncbi:DUF881 domain-containing protein [Candidatus Peregrinibacteria bacterium]|nr:DUF881 domain-containing protein [Candidatus Peregrinibacteria bacterium]